MKFNENEKRMWLEDWRKSGMSVWSYAKANGLNPQTFQRWTKIKDEQDSCFVQVSVPLSLPAPETPEIPKILIEKGDMKIHIPMVISDGALRTLIDWLRVAL